MYTILCCLSIVVSETSVIDVSLTTTQLTGLRLGAMISRRGGSSSVTAILALR